MADKTDMVGSVGSARVTRAEREWYCSPFLEAPCHDFEEAFTVLKGELEATFRGTKHVVRAGETINVPANARHQFHNSSSQPMGL